MVRREARGCLAGIRLLAGVVGFMALWFIIGIGIGRYLQDFQDEFWFGLLLAGCAGYAIVELVRGFIDAHVYGPERYAELHAAAIRLRDAGEVLQDATARGSRGEVTSAELHWLDAVAAVEALRPPPDPPRHP